MVMKKMVTLILLIIILIHFGNSINIEDSITKSFDNLYHGRFTRDVNSPELLIPKRVNKDGSFNTFSLPNFYNRHEVNERAKRSKDSDIDKLHLMLSFNNVDHHVELTPYHDFISPEMVIETRGDGHDMNERLRFRRVSDQQCHYRGFVRGHTNSKAVLSVCNDGVAGFVHTDNGRYFIEPMSESSPGSDGQHVHMAYKRQASHEKEDFKRRCGTGDDWESAWAEQLGKRERQLIENADSTSFKPSSSTHSIHRFVEIGLVADKKFLDYHKNNDYEKYLLTIMNMVSDFYHDTSVGNQIDIIVVRIIYLEKENEEIDLSISPQAEDTLASFAAWALKMNPKDHTHPNHFDIAVLVTRHDICSRDSGCVLMGLAYLAAACDPPKAAAINEDSGLLLGIVIAHEVGHVLGCAHDEIDVSGCPPQREDESYHLMSPIVFIYTFQWSTCSKRFITSLLESGLGECLNDDPRDPPEKFKFPDMLPGAMYDADFQCNLQYPGSTVCQNTEELNCEQLWCGDGEKCFSKSTPPAEGTKCAEKKWCIKKKCVEMGSRPKAINGGWSEWGKMNECSRSCGGGIKYAERECNNPVPSNGGRYCIGERKRMATCNIMPCDPNKPSFRASQCSEFDKQQILADGLHTWRPITKDNLDPCALFCVNEKLTFVKLSSTVKDSTPCKPGTNNMCIGGACRKVGCDWIIDSDAILDKCGICKGDGTHCTLVDGEYTEKSHGDYTKIVTIPKGARSIFIAEKKPSENNLAIKLSKGDTYCLNGNHNEDHPGEFPCAGASIIYNTPENQKEEIEIRDPITEDIELQYCFYKPQDNPGIKYSYYVMSGDKSNYTPKYLWDFTEWTPCDAKCGGGTMVSEATCIEQQNGVVSPSFCQDITKPEQKTRICNEKPCPAKWRVSQWSKCNACDNKEGKRRRKVQCVKPAARPGGEDVQADFKSCRGKVPKQEDTCIGTRPCKKTCPKRSRNIEHTERDIVPADDDDDELDKYIDLGIARYLENGDEDGHLDKTSSVLDKDFRSILHDLIYQNEKTCSKDKVRSMDEFNEKKFTTPKPGTIIKDTVPEGNAVLLEVPVVKNTLTTNVSDNAYHEVGDAPTIELDTSREKIYTGEEAAKKIDLMAHPNISSSTEFDTDAEVE